MSKHLNTNIDMDKAVTYFDLEPDLERMRAGVAALGLLRAPDGSRGEFVDAAGYIADSMEADLERILAHFRPGAEH
jgi:hypothetical protein